MLKKYEKDLGYLPNITYNIDPKYYLILQIKKLIINFNLISNKLYYFYFHGPSWKIILETKVINIKSNMLWRLNHFIFNKYEYVGIKQIYAKI